MSAKIDKLISLFCSRATEYKRLDEIFNTKNGYTPSKANSNYWNGNTSVPWFRMEDIREHGNILFDSIQHITPEAIKGELFPADSIIVATSATVGVHALIKVRSLANQRFTYLTLKEQYKSYYDINFLNYYCYKLDEWCLKHLNKSNFASVDMDKFYAFTFPVPPLEVQREIVRILDKFTLLSSELVTELATERIARKKQYEFYRNKMLTFKTEITRKRLGEIFDFRNGLNKGKEFFGRGTPFIRYTDVYNHRSLRKEDITALVECTSAEAQKLRVSRGDVFFTRTSETAEDVGWSAVMLDDIGDCVFNGFTIKATPKTDDLLPEYCAYCFSTEDFRSYVTTHCAFTTRASLTGSTIAEYQMAIPNMDVQQRIVNVLDNFETICSDLNIGLPAEIEARQKQYEYYRDMLLTFAETGEIILDRQTDRQAIPI